MLLFCHFAKHLPKRKGILTTARRLEEIMYLDLRRKSTTLYSSLKSNSQKEDLNTLYLPVKRYEKLCPQRSAFVEKRTFFQTTLSQEIIKRSPRLGPYLNLIRFDRPIGTWLLFLPCTWSISMAAEPGHLPDLKMLALFGTGSVLLRAAGCIINDMWDTDFDRRVARTKTRPLAARELTHKQALGFLASVLTCGLMILLSLNWYSIILGTLSMFFVVTYPLMKRITYWPQFFLGLTFNWGALLGWSAVKGSCDWSVVLPLYIACISWTLFYDTVYAHQDKEDDISIGVKSTALLFQEKTVYWLGAFSLSMLSCLTLSGYMADQTWPYYLSLAGVSGHLAWQALTVDFDSPNDCAAKFRSNKWLGLMLLSGIIAGSLIKEETANEKEANADP
ncbi:4-hydroxybenzoate polyprenyltransferase, mitochondrial-like [Rhopilema esculentum]|uniref:4-hydroxybenzoate polyprenyltransferase, mitochondrial-like n=1 Tax=Rhopilema esculentum TaxID=499914 RepID=UPI0031D8A1CB